MTKAIIVNDCDNYSLLRFTQTKLFFDAKNIGRPYFNDCVTVDNFNSAERIYNAGDVILQTGDFLTSAFFRQPIKYAKDSEHVIKFDKTIPVDFKNRRYEQGSKQLYIIENLLKVCIRSKKLLYLDNNENEGTIKPQGKHLYGLASGYKTAKYSLEHNFETVTVYDYCDRQLEFAEWLHSKTRLPNSVNVAQPTSGVYKVPDLDWNRWHSTKVQFKKLDLFDNPVFPQDSFIWISNIYYFIANSS